jgi:hypothetical protein
MDEKSANLQNWHNRLASEIISETNANISRYYKYLRKTIKLSRFTISISLDTTTMSIVWEISLSSALV